jgi:hypothetical protein
MSMTTINRRHFLKQSALGAGGYLLCSRITRAGVDLPFRAFNDKSEWNKPIPADAPIDPDSGKFVEHIKGFNPKIQGLKLSIDKWAEPFYWAKEGDPWYEIAGFPVPRVRIPKGAVPATNSDSEMTIFDLEKGWVIKFWRASFDGKAWHTSSKTWYALASNGLEGRLPESDEKRNTGHRGYPPALHGVRWDEVKGGILRHTLKVGLDKTGESHVYPGCGHEKNRGGIIPEGAIFRIKPSVDLASRGLKSNALVIARAIQTYGVVVGDTGNTPMALKMEALEKEGRPERWSQLGIETDSLAVIRFDDFECIKLGYHRP